MVAAGLFNAYDMQLFSLALKQIQAGLAIKDAQLGLLGSAIRLGVIPGALLALLADSLGRRRLLLWTIVGYTLATGATALAPDEFSFVIRQFLARSFGGAEAILAGVVIAEEMDSDQRGWAMGVLGAFLLFFWSRHGVDPLSHRRYPAWRLEEPVWSRDRTAVSDHPVVTPTTFQRPHASSSASPRPTRARPRALPPV